MTWWQIVLAVFFLGVLTGWIVIPLGILKLVTPERWWRKRQPTRQWLEQAERELFPSSSRESPIPASRDDDQNRTVIPVVPLRRSLP